MTRMEQLVKELSARGLVEVGANEAENLKRQLAQRSIQPMRVAIIRGAGQQKNATLRLL